MKTHNQFIQSRRQIEQFAQQIYNGVLRSSGTSYVHRNCGRIQGHDDQQFITGVIDRLKNLFPGCIVEYVETKSVVDGNVLERVYRVDWS